MMKRKTKLLLLLALVVLLGGGYTALCLFSPAHEPHSHEEAPPLLQVEKTSAVKIEFNTHKESLTLEKKDEFWHLSDDEAFPLDQDIPKNMLAVLAPLTSLREVSASPEDSALYGFDSPVIVSVTDGLGTHRFLLGDKCNATEGYYLRTSETSPVYLVSESVGIVYCHEDRYDLIVIDPYPSVKEEDMTRVILRSPQGTKALKKTDGTLFADSDTPWAWESEQGLQKADKQTVEAILEQISSLSFVACLDHQLSDKEHQEIFSEAYGFTVEYIHHGKDDQGKELLSSQSFEFCVEASLWGDDTYRARLFSSPQLCLVEKESIDALWNALR